MALVTFPTPHNILATLLPHLRVAAHYANEIQQRICAQPEKSAGHNFFSTALTDADLSIQTFFEVLLLGSFPLLRFYGEEYEKTYNTKYLRGIDFGEGEEYLLTLDPIDGTRCYMDGHKTYQIILGILSKQGHEAAVSIHPATDEYFWALRGKGTKRGAIADDLDACQPIQLGQSPLEIYFSWSMERFAEPLRDRYAVASLAESYSAEQGMNVFSTILQGQLCGGVLRAGRFLDTWPLAFLAQEAGAIVTTFDGESVPPAHTHQNYELPSLLVATSEGVHQDLLNAVKQVG
ncbi:MAG: inositol monophosphatase family protein [Spirulina sp. SIO3F2]|nr:inositol monophosphatase family protein [Spirulina sp. SIO3F2]